MLFRSQEELREKYNPDNIFKDRQKNIEVTEQEIEDTTAIVTYKETFLSKIINKIKLFFNK